MISVSTVAPLISLSSKRLMTEEEQNITIDCRANGQPSPNITWSKATGSLPDRTQTKNGALQIYNVHIRDGGTYIYEAENILGTTEDTVQLIVFTRLRFLVRPPKQLNPVVGSPVRLPCEAESDLRPTVTWLKDGKASLPVDSTILQNNTLVIPSVKKSHGGTYSSQCIAT